MCVFVFACSAVAAAAQSLENSIKTLFLLSTKIISTTEEKIVITSEIVIDKLLNFFHFLKANERCKSDSS